MHVHFVDDNMADLMLTNEILESHADVVEVSTSLSGPAALEFLRDSRNSRPDVVVLDINMPGLSGFEVLAAMKSDPALVDIPVVMLSTSSNPRDVAQAYTLHASSYLVKAHDFQQFVQQIEAFITYLRQTRLTHWPNAMTDA
ncbi:response regulator [Deinococcus koreensis]|uniref:Response regulator n=1 Tax=Deinococcus koreensis TaxID=2054903 RepID=A0A2K3V2D8_9DEIO|nr:response regulator [Deinococcus koreensis]